MIKNLKNLNMFEYQIIDRKAEKDTKLKEDHKK